MTSTQFPDTPSPSKRRRITRACDNCRRRKGKCDSLLSSGSRCSTCVSFNIDCTFKDEVKKRGPRGRYVTGSQYCSTSSEGSYQEPVDTVPPAHPRASKSSISSLLCTSPYSTPSSQTPRTVDSTSEDSHSDEDYGPPLYDTFAKVDLERARIVFNPASTQDLIVSTMRLNKDLRTKDLHNEWERDNPWTIDPWEMEEESAAKHALSLHHYCFPDEDLLPLLVDAYFTHINAYMPLLHRPTLEYNLAEQVHQRDTGFGALVLVVCALGARYVDDERVCLSGCPPRSAGWRYFNQLQLSRRLMLNKPRLCDVQLYLLSAMFLGVSANGNSIWMLVGIAQRMLLEVGAHRQKFYSKTLNPRDELWKRAFWVTLSLDRILASDFGKPSLMRDEDYDVTYPVDCDDEFWMTNDQRDAFVQPHDKPSSMTFFIYFIKLQRIHAVALHSLLMAKGPTADAPTQNWNVAVDIDSELNRWLDSLPEHLRWDPQRNHTLFFHQSAMLSMNFYALQIVVHRPFATSRAPESPAFTSMAICTNAARSTSHILALQTQRPIAPLHNMHIFVRAFNSALVLLLDIYGGRRPYAKASLRQEMEDVKKCISVLDSCEVKTPPARFFKKFLLRYIPPEFQSPTPDSENSTRKRRQSSEISGQDPQGYDTQSYRHQADQDLSLLDTRAAPTLGLNQLGFPDVRAGTNQAPLHTISSASLGYALPPSISHNEWSGPTEAPSVQSSTIADDLFNIWAGMNDGLGILEWGVYLDGMPNAQPVVVPDIGSINGFNGCGT